MAKAPKKATPGKARSATKPKSAKGTTKKASRPGGGAKGKATGFADQLDSLEKDWQSARTQAPRQGGFEAPDIPDGTYPARLVGASVGKGKGDKPPYFKFQFLIAFGEYKGTKLTVFDNISNEPLGDSDRTGLNILSDRLQMLGVDISKMPLKDLPKVASWLTDPEQNDEAQPYVMVGIVNKFSPSKKNPNEMRRFQNVYVNGLIDEEDLAELQENEPEDDED